MVNGYYSGIYDVMHVKRNEKIKEKENRMNNDSNLRVFILSILNQIINEIKMMDHANARKTNSTDHHCDMMLQVTNTVCAIHV